MRDSIYITTGLFDVTTELCGTQCEFSVMYNYANNLRLEWVITVIIIDM